MMEVPQERVVTKTHPLLSDSDSALEEGKAAKEDRKPGSENSFLKDKVK